MEIMAGPVRDEADERLMAAGRRGGEEEVQLAAKGAHEIDVPPLVPGTDIVGFPDPAVEGDPDEGGNVILNVNPIPDLAAIAVNRDEFQGRGFPDDQGNQFFRELAGSVIVAGMGDDDWKSVGLMPRADEVVGAGLACRVWGARGVWAGFIECACGPESSVDFIRGDVDELRRASGDGPGCLQQGTGTEEIGMEKIQGCGDRAVHVSLSGKVEHHVRAEGGEGGLHRGSIRDIRMKKIMTKGCFEFFQESGISGICEKIDIEDMVSGCQEGADEVATDEAAATCHHHPAVCFFLALSLQ